MLRKTRVCPTLTKFALFLFLSFIWSDSNCKAAQLESSSSAAKDHPSLLVYGAIPGGAACAIRAAREGLDVLLVSRTAHLGGMFTNGLSTMDTLNNGRRAPL